MKKFILLLSLLYSKEFFSQNNEINNSNNHNFYKINKNINNKNIFYNKNQSIYIKNKNKYITKYNDKIIFEELILNKNFDIEDKYIFNYNKYKLYWI